ncbi:MAG: glycerophosphodiester phosphodiesterase [Myxococcales bacterium]|nr:glycerophosphodiester phosphodiesterase [Myxococcales bacterium]
MFSKPSTVVVLVLFLLTCFFGTQAYTSPTTKPASQPQHRYRPLIIGHRGAPGFLPEHTLASYRLAIQQGADYIEPDLVMSKDGVLIARHENNITGTTDVAQKFPQRKRTKWIDGEKITGFFTEDFTLAELKTLRAKERLPFRNQRDNGRYSIPTFEEILRLLQDHTRATGKVIGIYPETKHPSYFRSIGLPLEGALLRVLKKHGLDHEQAPVFIQSFEVNNLRKLHQQTKIRLIQLLSIPQHQPYDFTMRKDHRKYGDLLTTKGLRFVASYAYGIGPWKGMLVKRQGTSLVDTGLVQRAHQAGLRVHLYTMRDEGRFQLPLGKKDPLQEYAFFFRMGVDGFFADSPITAQRALVKYLFPTPPPAPKQP